ncbi:MAG: hypothetical protein GKR88_14025 [Flavobacteriaceae bacterium]|nr:MAG: hypothetical protein GKR88_14025 [Flavobacteriaceae bacterium]
MITVEPPHTKEFFERSFESAKITEDRKSSLMQIAEVVINRYKIDKTVNLNFICTYNSRRSQFGQAWSYFASHYFNVNIHSFSGGTEITAFHANTVEALQKAGFIFKLIHFSHRNPVYDIRFEGAEKGISGFSKMYHDKINKKPFIAITTCNSADAECSFIPEAIQRFHLPYTDPKFSDNTEKQGKTYLKTSRQVAAEMFYFFSAIKIAV